MIKSIFAAACAATAFIAAPAVAGPYIDGGVEINTANDESVDQSYVVVGGYEYAFTDQVFGYVEAGGGLGAIGDGNTEGVIRAAAGLGADINDNVTADVRYEFNRFQASDVTTGRYTANIRYTF